MRGHKKSGDPDGYPAFQRRPIPLERCWANMGRGRASQEEMFPAVPPSVSPFRGGPIIPPGSIGDLGDLPDSGEVALGPMLRRSLGIPVFINNDGYCSCREAIAGFLPHVNGL